MLGMQQKPKQKGAASALAGLVSHEEGRRESCCHKDKWPEMRTGISARRQPGLASGRWERLPEDATLELGSEGGVGIV